MYAMGSAESEKQEMFPREANRVSRELSRQGLRSKPICCFKENNWPDLWPIKNQNFGKKSSFQAKIRTLENCHWPWSFSILIRISGDSNKGHFLYWISSGRCALNYSVNQYFPNNQCMMLETHAWAHPLKVWATIMVLMLTIQSAQGFQSLHCN